MKNKELSPAIIAGVVAAVLVIVVAIYFIGTRGPSGKVDVNKIDFVDKDPPGFSRSRPE